MRRPTMIVAILFTILLSGCVSTGTHQETVDELGRLRKASAQTETAFEAFKKQAEAEKQQLTNEIAALQQDKTRLSEALLAEQTTASRAKASLEATLKALANEEQARRNLESNLSKLTGENQQLEQMGAELRRERDQYETKADDLQRRYETSQEELAGARRSLTDAETRIAALNKETSQLSGALTEARNHMRDLEAKLSAEEAKVTILQTDKKRLLSGTTTAQDEIGRLQKQAGELETQAARAVDLEKRLAEQDQEVSRLRQASAERDALASKTAGLTDELEKTRQRLSTLTGDLAALSDTQAKTAQERDRLANELRKQREQLEAEGSEKARLERERAEKEAEIQRLTKTREDLDRALQAEVQKGDIRIKQVRDRLTINMVDRVLFDSGQALVKPAGLKVLKQVSDVLRTVADKQIRIEGHTDNVPIGPRIKDRFPTNWELSAARATSVVRYLIEEGGVDPNHLSAIGYADNRPVASNDTEEGRQSNRRIEIVLYPKDLSEIASQIRP